MKKISKAYGRYEGYKRKRETKSLKKLARKNKMSEARAGLMQGQIKEAKAQAQLQKLKAKGGGFMAGMDKFLDRDRSVSGFSDGLFGPEPKGKKKKKTNEDFLF